VPENLEELSDEMLADRLRNTARRLKAVNDEIDVLIQEAGRRKLAGNRRWTQDKIAELVAMSQQAISKRQRKARSANSGDTTE
jgi:hypothetical protein